MKRFVTIAAILAFTLSASAAMKITGDDRQYILEPKSNGSIDVNIQDQSTKPIDTYFLQSVTNFTLSAPTVASGTTQTSLVYTFTATTGHGITAGNEILLLDTIADTDFYANVMSITNDIITVDRPIENVFPSATTLGRIVTSEMAVDGSTTEQIFTVRGGADAFDITRILLQMTHASAGDDSKFGGITALDRGLVFRVADGFQKNIFNFKTNGDIRAFCFDIAYSDKAGGGANGTGARITFAGQSKHGVTLRISGNDVLQWIVQDDLTGLDSLKIVAQGHVVED